MLKFAVDMIFKAPLELLAAAVLFWVPFALPVVVLKFGVLYDMLSLSVIICVAIYFTLAAVVGTLALKNALIHYLLDARANGTLIADEGKKAKSDVQADEEEDAEE